jgi:hypothetical protein
VHDPSDAGLDELLWTATDPRHTDILAEMLPRDHPLVSRLLALADVRYSLANTSSSSARASSFTDQPDPGMRKP